MEITIVFICSITTKALTQCWPVVLLFPLFLYSVAKEDMIWSSVLPTGLQETVTSSSSHSPPLSTYCSGFVRECIEMKGCIFLSSLILNGSSCFLKEVGREETHSLGLTPSWCLLINIKWCKNTRHTWHFLIGCWWCHAHVTLAIKWADLFSLFVCINSVSQSHYF